MDLIDDENEVITHTFYCDDCGKVIGESEEYDDGYYHELGEVNMHFNMPNLGWMDVKKHLCDNCKNTYYAKVYNTLHDLGFKRGGV